MFRFQHLWVVILAAAGSARIQAADKDALAAVLAHEIIGPQQALKEVERYVDARVPRMPPVKTVQEWEQHANKMRAQLLENVVYRGEAATWRDAKGKVEWLDTIQGGP